MTTAARPSEWALREAARVFDATKSPYHDMTPTVLALDAAWRAGRDAAAGVCRERADSHAAASVGMTPLQDSDISGPFKVADIWKSEAIQCAVAIRALEPS